VVTTASAWALKHGLARSLSPKHMVQPRRMQHYIVHTVHPSGHKAAKNIISGSLDVTYLSVVQCSFYYITPRS